MKDAKFIDYDNMTQSVIDFVLDFEQKIYINCTSVSRSGMSHTFRIFALCTVRKFDTSLDTELLDITSTFSKVAGLKLNKDFDISMPGCGYDKARYMLEQFILRCNPEIQSHIAYNRPNIKVL